MGEALPGHVPRLPLCRAAGGGAFAERVCMCLCLRAPRPCRLPRPPQFYNPDVNVKTLTEHDFQPGCEMHEFAVSRCSDGGGGAWPGLACSRMQTAAATGGSGGGGWARLVP